MTYNGFRNSAIESPTFITNAGNAGTVNVNSIFRWLQKDLEEAIWQIPNRLGHQTQLRKIRESRTGSLFPPARSTTAAALSIAFLSSPTSKMEFKGLGLDLTDAAHTASVGVGSLKAPSMLTFMLTG